MSQTNSLDLDSDRTAIIAMRILNAPRALVWKVWSDPEHLAHWWGPNGFSITTHSFDMRPGGVWRFVMHGPDGRDYQNRITYEEIVPPERLVTRHGGGDDVEPVQFRTTVTLDDLGAKTRLTMRMQFTSAEIRKQIIDAYGADKGLVQTLARLDAHLETISGG
jgi:uncharacterized protein YndB with AHSA1/START domain